MHQNQNGRGGSPDVFFLQIAKNCLGTRLNIPGVESTVTKGVASLTSHTLRLARLGCGFNAHASLVQLTLGLGWAWNTQWVGPD